jgi:hypothetical protein
MEERAMWIRIFWVIGAGLLCFFGRCAWWCATTWNEPDYFGFLPQGDVALGLHSHQGRLSLVQIAEWQADPLYFKGEMAWQEVLGYGGVALVSYAVMLGIVTLLVRRSRSIVGRRSE